MQSFINSFCRSAIRKNGPRLSRPLIENHRTLTFTTATTLARFTGSPNDRCCAFDRKKRKPYVSHIVPVHIWLRYWDIDYLRSTWGMSCDYQYSSSTFKDNNNTIICITLIPDLRSGFENFRTMTYTYKPYSLLGFSADRFVKENTTKIVTHFQRQFSS